MRIFIGGYIGILYGSKEPRAQGQVRLQGLGYPASLNPKPFAQGMPIPWGKFERSWPSWLPRCLPG